VQLAALLEQGLGRDLAERLNAVLPDQLDRKLLQLDRLADGVDLLLRH
jgi:hypothetical protein